MTLPSALALRIRFSDRTGRRGRHAGMRTVRARRRTVRYGVRALHRPIEF